MTFYIACAAALTVFLTLLFPEIRYYFFNQVGRWLYIFLFALSLSFLLTPVMRRLAMSLNVLDIPETRKIHNQATPLLGGGAIIIAFTVALLANMVLEREIIVILYAGGAVAVTSLIDDWKGLRARTKLIVQIGAVAFLIYNDIILNLFPVRLWWGYALNILLTMIWIIGITNAMNFIDGMDGLAAGLGAIISLFLAIVAFQTNQHILGWISLAMLGSCLGFLPFNFRPTRPAAIFLGDTGSIFLGFILASLAIVGEWADNNPIVSFSAPVLIFWVLIFDMTYITVERIATGKVKSIRQWLEYVGKDHLHHRTYTLLGDRRKAVLFIYLLSVTLGVSAIALRYARPVDGILLVIQACLITIVVSILDYSGRNR
ncbi:MAG TPA: MraY family glycosyltransferase [Syntrophales bacterium]|jgi:UDP-GlcNAc:undecaprenyl-phosphate GlcNAc-1-phosphate transferase|nr:MraY family glycosyltransferase [Syntrophales bacterium]